MIEANCHIADLFLKSIRPFYHEGRGTATPLSPKVYVDILSNREKPISIGGGGYDSNNGRNNVLFLTKQFQVNRQATVSQQCLVPQIYGCDKQ